MITIKWTNAQFGEAQKYLAQQDFAHARLACERIAFKASPNDTIWTKALLLKAQCYKLDTLYDDALQTLLRILQNQPQIKSHEVWYEATLCAFLSGQYTIAQDLVAQAEQACTIPKSHRLNYLNILILNQLARWDEAQLAATEYANSLGAGLDIDSIYQVADSFRFKNPKKARLLSSLFPGLGQFYAGYPLEGLASLGLQGAFIAYGVVSISDQHYLSAIFTGLGMTTTFYGGGIRRAQVLAVRKNQTQANRINRQLFEALKPLPAARK